ncbi:MarR family transcriptional regulator [Flavonifractor sp. An100]|uniref:MarR family transcriptional regulator n=1 Tax=Flavonifractor sp. An100 TaxID=1965538 RepID=UPI000B399DB8|nr:MarR family transcriptional regulator [Flavonifractor sp. An100]OUQ77064.1 hypothetical protein B5E43_10785 [Flavonifractor sp. An100]
MIQDYNAIPVDTLFNQLNEKANEVYKFVMLYSQYMSEQHYYGVGIPINMVEIHTLTAIEENPGITISQLASMWQRTNSALSQTATKLEQKGYIIRRKDPNNARNVQLYATESGQELSVAHKAYDTMNVTQTLQELSRSCTPQQIDNFFYVLHAYIQLLEQDQE